ncbi:MAG: hypothetical protein IPL39_17630 [Opitutaceae bacterium]|nr:hypothetical protein [Opitutaceae bacterium]
MPLISLLTGTAVPKTPSPLAKRSRPGQSWLRLLGGVALASLAAGGTNAATKTGLEAPMVVAQVPSGSQASQTQAAASGLARADWFDGSRLVLVAPDGKLRVLSEGFAAACDPNVSFDGQRVLFAGRKTAADHWRIWEIGPDGKNLRPVTPEGIEARNAIHVSTLFTLDSPKPWFTTVFVGRETAAGPAAPWNLYNIRLEGGEFRRLTFNHGQNLDPYQTADGRVLYAAERSAQEPGGGDRRLSLFAIHMEGADNELYGATRGARVQQMPCATEQGLVVFVESAEPAADGSGQLAAVEHRRPHVTYRPLTTDAAYRFLYPSPLRGNQLLVSRRPAQDAGTCGIFRFDATTGRCDPVFDDPKFHDVQASVVAPRQQPDGHSTVVTAADNYGALYGLNCYTTTPARAAGTKVGDVKRVRFLEGVAAPSATAANGLVPRRLIGEAPVEADGSINVELPADTPLILQTVDERGLALGTCGWIWVKPRENRACIGCHEDPELVPENKYVQSLRRLPNRLVPAPEARRSVSFIQDVVPILQKSCATAGCHGSTMSPLQLPLSAANLSESDLRKAYQNLTVPAASLSGETTAGPAAGKYVDAGRARTSRLAWMLLGENTSRPWDASATKTSPALTKHRVNPTTGESPRLGAEELRTVLLWIDLGAQFDTPQTPATTAAASPVQPSK